MRRVRVFQSQEVAGQAGVDKMKFRHTNHGTLGAVAHVRLEPADDKHEFKYLHIPFDSFVVLGQVIGYIGVFDEIACHPCQVTDKRREFCVILTFGMMHGFEIFEQPPFNI